MRFNSPVLEAYGMTEASHQMSSNPMPPSDRIAGTVGTATGVQIAIMDDNGQLVPQGNTSEVVIKGPNLMLGYRDNRKANAEAFKNGWFRTGDQGVLSSRGYLTLTGRLKELINRGGEKISPIEIDAVLLKHPSVAEAVTFGIPDDKYGEAVCAAVIIKGEADPEELRRHCADHLASFKVPDRVFISDRLPRTATGKIQRRHIASTFTVED
jgi:acyl-CoA synthetase (AMP-forming)/AMP-acid ligase II